MTIKRIDPLEELQGQGGVFNEAGSSVGECTYYITVLQEVIDAGGQSDPNAELLGLKQIHGTVDGIDPTTQLGKPLTLKIEDGRLLDFFNSDGDGRISHRAG